jgi:uncharacterized protein involved in exopolysaccharide biosynthesis
MTTQTETTQRHTSLDDLPPLEASPPNVGTAVRRHPIIVLVSVLVCLVLAVAYGFARKPTYTANAKLQVGSIDLKLPGAIGGLQSADADLATAYSRQIQAQTVLKSVATQLHLPEATVMAALSSTPVPLSGNFTVTAATKAQNQAVKIANAASYALVAYVASQNNNNAYVKTLWSEYQAAAAQVSAAQTANLLAHQVISQSKGHPTAAQLAALTKAQTALDTASTNKQGIQSAYFTAKSQETNTPQVITPALQAASDRATKLEILLVGGLAVGLLVGATLATIRARRKARVLG